MRILMLGNSLTSAQDMPDILAELTGAEVVCHTRGGARLSEHLNPNTRLGARTQAALAKEQWDYVVLQEMSHGPITAPGSFFASVERLCRQIRENGAIPVLYATWAYQKGGARLSAKALSVCGRMAGMSLWQRFPICTRQRRKEWTVWRAFISTSFVTPSPAICCPTAQRRRTCRRFLVIRM